MAIASYGVINRLTFVFAMMVMGLNQGMQPIAGYNYGAKHMDRLLQSFYLTCAYATGVMGIVFILGECFPELVTKMFTHDIDLISQTIRPMRIICSTMLIIGFQMVTGNLFTSVGKAGKSIFLSLTRQVIYLIPLALWGGLSLSATHSQLSQLSSFSLPPVKNSNASAKDKVHACWRHLCLLTKIAAVELLFCREDVTRKLRPAIIVRA